MKFIFSLLLVLFFLSNSISQSPELVVDFNSGSGDSFSGNYSGVTLNDIIILPVVSTEFGEEPAIIKNGDLNLLKDINNGSNSSAPKLFTVYNGAVYFVANDGINGPCIWKTDGSESGTELFFDPGEDESSTPRAFLEAQNGWLYYNYEDKIFRTNGSINEEVYSGASLGYIFSEASTNYCRYKNGIAFVHKNDNYSFSLIHIDNDQANVLAETETTSFFANGFGIAPLSAGLMFSISGSNNHDAIYVYDELSTSLNQLLIEGELIPSRRTIDFNDQINICWISRKGYYSINGIPGEEELLIESSNFSAGQGDNILYAIHENKLAFIPIAGLWFDDDFLVYTDGSLSGTSKIKTIQNQYLSRMLTFKNYAFIVEGVSNNFNPNIIQIDIETGEALDLYTFTERSTNINSVKPVGIIGDYLYFISNLDNSVGTELYKIRTEIMVNTKEIIESHKMVVKQTGDQISIETSIQESLSIHIYNTSGQLVFSATKRSNQPFYHNLPNGFYFINITTEQGRKTEALYIK